MDFPGNSCRKWGGILLSPSSSASPPRPTGFSRKNGSHLFPSRSNKMKIFNLMRDVKSLYCLHSMTKNGSFIHHFHEEMMKILHSLNRFERNSKRHRLLGQTFGPTVLDLVPKWRHCLPVSAKCLKRPTHRSHIRTVSTVETEIRKSESMIRSKRGFTNLEVCETEKKVDESTFR